MCLVTEYALQSLTADLTFDAALFIMLVTSSLVSFKAILMKVIKRVMILNCYVNVNFESCVNLN